MMAYLRQGALRDATVALGRATVTDHTATTDGHAVVHFSDLAETIAGKKPGDRVTLGIIRGGMHLQLPVTLGAQSG
jgi:S1-C subfamily serine protease